MYIYIYKVSDEILRTSYFIFFFIQSEIGLKEIQNISFLKKGPIFWPSEPKINKILRYIIELAYVVFNSNFVILLYVIE